MKKIAILTLALSLFVSMLVGCGCMNTGNDVPTLPTNGESSAPTTAVTTQPATVPTTAATTEAPMESTDSMPTDTTGTLEGAMDDIMGGSTDDTTEATDAGRSRSRGNGPRIR